MAKTRKRSNGEGTIFQQKPGLWRAMVTVSGTRRSFTAGTQGECKVWVRDQLTKADQGFDFSRSQVTLAEYLHHWIETAAVALRPKTVKDYPFGRDYSKDADSPPRTPAA